MLALLQRVKHSEVQGENITIASIEKGSLVFLCIEKEDDEKKADRMLERILGYRIFPDHNDRMNLNVKDINGGLLIVPQFTLAADTKKGMRPSFTTMAKTQSSKSLFYYFVEQAKQKHQFVEAGKFAADMQVHLCNDGPVTFFLR